MRLAGFFFILFISIAGLSIAAQTQAPSSISALTQRATSGDAEAQFELARAYEDGKGLPQDDAKAVEWFRRSAEQGNAQAQNSLGVMYALGRGVTRDREEAVRWYKKAAKLGLPEAIYNVAISYYNGEGSEENIGLACSWMMVAQRKGDAQATEALTHIGQELNGHFDRCKMDLAALYEKGDEIPQDLPAAVAMYKEAAQKNFKESLFAGPAQYKMCQLYAAGKGVPQDYAEAKSWCKKTDTPFALVVLARMAEKGLGGPKDLPEARSLYRKAAMAGLGDGFMESARLQLESGTHQGEKEAYFWYAIAAKLKLAGAAEKLREVVPKLSDRELAEESKQVNDWFKLPQFKRVNELRKH